MAKTKSKKVRASDLKREVKKPVNNVVVVSDTHCGCALAICDAAGCGLDDGGLYMPSKLQLKLWAMWREFWDEWVPEATRGEPFAVVHNGDAIDGVHHGSTTQISQNLSDQNEIAFRLLAPIVELCEGRYYHIRGTEAHVAKSGAEEERLAKRLGSIPNSEGQFARWDLWKNVGDGLIHCLHHVGTTGSNAYESTAVHKELVESFTEAGRWGHKPPSIIVRSHRHRSIITEIPIEGGSAKAVVTPAWQSKTPFAWKIPGARLTTPQFGGILIRQSHGRLFIDPKTWTIAHSATEP